MSAKCSVANCQLKSKVTFHSPQSRPHLELWKKILNIKVDSFFVCDQHFEEKFFRIEKRLTVDAFPTQYIGNVEPGNADFCQCCMKSFVRSKFITQNEGRVAIEDKFQKEFVDVIGCEIPNGLICIKCFETITNFTKFRNEIRDKQKVRQELIQLQAEQESSSQFTLDPNIKIKEEPKDNEELESMLDIQSETFSDPTMMPIKDEPMDEEEFVIKEEKVDIGTEGSFLISEVKTEAEEMGNEIITKTTTVSMPNSTSRPRIVIKRPTVRPAQFQNFKVIQPQKLVKIIRGPINGPGTANNLSNSPGSMKIAPVQFAQLENSPNMLGYKCQYCPNRFIERKFVVDHIKQKHTFPCSLCKSVFPFKITLIKHQMSMHPSNGNQPLKALNYKYDCRICALKFLSSHMLDAHMLQKHQGAMIEEKINNQDGNVVVIRQTTLPTKPSTIASSAFKTIRVVQPKSPAPQQLLQPSTSQIQIKSEPPLDLGQPIRVKLQPPVKKPVNTLIKKILTPVGTTPVASAEPIVEDPDGIPCLDCGLLLKPDKLLKHRMDAHDLNTHNLFYFCDLCGIEIKGKTQLINHMTTKHLSSNFVRCEFCDGLYESLTDVICHKNLQHNFNGTRYTCHFCYKIFTTKRDMILHRKAHYSEKESRDKLARVFCKKFKSYEPKGVEYK